MNKIILADNQAIFRAGIAKVLASEEDFRVAAQCADLERLLVDPPMRETVGERGRDLFAREFSDDALRKRFSSEMRRVGGETRGAAA